MTDLTRGAVAFCPAQSMPAMLGRPLVSPIGADRRIPAFAAADGVWRAVLGLLPSRRAAAPSGNPAARAAIAEIFATRAIPVTAIALAAVTGVVAGALGVTALSAFGTDRTASQQVAALTEQMARLDGELAALKHSAQSGDQAISAKVAKLTERMDKNERRTALAGASQDTTGSVAARGAAGQPLAPIEPIPIPQASPVRTVPAQTAALSPASPKSAVLDGFRLRGVFDGLALLDSRFGPVEVEPGDILPGGIRVETIQRRAGRWVVVTNRGLITSR